MVGEQVERNAERLRRTATELRKLAQQTRSWEARQRLLRLAAECDRIAGDIEGSGSGPQ